MQKVPALLSTHSSKGCASSATLKGLISWSSIASLKATETRSQSSWVEIAQFTVDAVVTSEQSWVRAAKKGKNATPTIMVINGDPVAMGLVDSLARPGGNITGLTRLNRELSGKRLELLKEVVPTISRVGVLTVVDARTVGDALKEYRAAARAFKIAIRPLRSEVQTQTWTNYFEKRTTVE
jgi:ABC-type uncharacterized transport system substrate-binding protein